MDGSNLPALCYQTTTRREPGDPGMLGYIDEDHISVMGACIAIVSRGKSTC